MATTRTSARQTRPARAVGIIVGFVLWLVAAPAPASAESALSGGSVTPTSGTTETAFTFSVNYTSTDSPNRPAQAVWAQVGDVTIPLTKVSGSSHDGTWQGTSTLPVGTWAVTFHVTTSGEPQPAPLPGPTATVTEPPPTPEPPPPPPPTEEPAPPPDEPAPPPAEEPAPLRDPGPPAPILPPAPAPRSTASPIASPSAGSATTSAMARIASPTRSASEDDAPAEHEATAEPAESPEASGPDDSDPPPGSRFAALLWVGGSMTLGGAAVLARQWLVSRSRRH